MASGKTNVSGSKINGTVLNTVTKGTVLRGDFVTQSDDMIKKYAPELLEVKSGTMYTSRIIQDTIPCGTKGVLTCGNDSSNGYGIILYQEFDADGTATINVSYTFNSYNTIRAELKHLRGSRYLLTFVYYNGTTYVIDSLVLLFNQSTNSFTKGTAVRIDTGPHSTAPFFSTVIMSSAKVIYIYKNGTSDYDTRCATISADVITLYTAVASPAEISDYKHATAVLPNVSGGALVVRNKLYVLSCPSTTPSYTATSFEVAITSSERTPILYPISKDTFAYFYTPSSTMKTKIALLTFNGSGVLLRNDDLGEITDGATTDGSQSVQLTPTTFVNFYRKTADTKTYGKVIKIVGGSIKFGTEQEVAVATTASNVLSASLLYGIDLTNKIGNVHLKYIKDADGIVLYKNFIASAEILGIALQNGTDIEIQVSTG